MVKSEPKEVAFVDPMASPKKKKQKVFYKTWVSQTKRHKIKCFKTDENMMQYDVVAPRKHRFQRDKLTGKLMNVSESRTPLQVELKPAV